MVPAIAFSTSGSDSSSRTTRETSRRPRSRARVSRSSEAIAQGYAVDLLPFVGSMQLRLEWTALTAAVLLLSLAGCSDGAQPTAVALPEAARALAVAPDFAGTLWETTGRRAWRSHDGGLSWRRVRGPGGGIAVAFSERGGEVVGPHGEQRADYGGIGPTPPRGAPQPFISPTAPHHPTHRLYALDIFGPPRGWGGARRHPRQQPGGRAAQTGGEDS